MHDRAVRPDEDERPERVVRVRDTDLCVQAFGGPRNEPVLLVGNSMLTWPDGLCRRLAAGGRRVIRYDLRDTGRSRTVDPDHPAYTLRDLVTDAVGLLDALGAERAHVAGFGVGGWIAQLLALDHGDRVASLTLVATRPTAPGPSDPDLPDHDPELMPRLMAGPQPDWSDPEQVVPYMTRGRRELAGSDPFDEAEAREQVRRIVDRAVKAAPEGADLAKILRSNLLGTVFAALDCGARWRERLPRISAPTLVVHGAEDRFFPVGNGEALAREIPGAELLVLLGVGQELPGRVHDVLARALLDHTTPVHPVRQGG